jgi:hypothetical protein
MSPFVEANRDSVVGDVHLGGGVHEVPEKTTRRGLRVTVADACAQQRLLAMRVNCRSQLTFIATAEESASI